MLATAQTTGAIGAAMSAGHVDHPAQNVRYLIPPKTPTRSTRVQDDAWTGESRHACVRAGPRVVCHAIEARGRRELLESVQLPQTVRNGGAWRLFYHIPRAGPSNPPPLLTPCAESGAGPGRLWPWRDHLRRRPCVPDARMTRGLSFRRVSRSVPFCMLADTLVPLALGRDRQNQVCTEYEHRHYILAPRPSGRPQAHGICQAAWANE